MIKEIIVVEGKDDIAKIKSSLDAEVVATGGFGYDGEFIQNLKTISEKKGIIILTDPDFAGEKIRKDISRRVP
ncbi:MAG: toprim domain-containing protein, partial [Tissierellia bacterium]|nr:toprim domain-containing protein [Tissierellia bacterium]